MCEMVEAKVVDSFIFWIRHVFIWLRRKDVVLEQAAVVEGKWDVSVVRIEWASWSLLKLGCCELSISCWSSKYV